MKEYIEQWDSKHLCMLIISEYEILYLINSKEHGYSIVYSSAFKTIWKKGFYNMGMQYGHWKHEITIFKYHL